MKPDLQYLRTRISVDVSTGSVTWIYATKQHMGLNGKTAGTPVTNHSGKTYWHIKVDGRAIKRSHIVFLFATGKWPSFQIDHVNGNSIDDRIGNLREATMTQNAWNHKTRAKKSTCPMGIRQLPSGRYEARITANKVQLNIGTFDTQEEAGLAYQQKRKELFGEYA
jgi:hypothetical protein